jgi:hypothetical protein
MLIAIAVALVVILIHQHINFRSLKNMNDTERKLVNDLSTKRIEDLLLAGETDSPDFVAGVQQEIDAINAAATHLVEFTVPSATPDAPVPVIPPAATELPAASSTDTSTDTPAQ